MICPLHIKTSVHLLMGLGRAVLISLQKLQAFGLYQPPDWTTTGPFGRLVLQVTCRALSILFRKIHWVGSSGG